jgi:hypothetical protein
LPAWLQGRRRSAGSSISAALTRPARRCGSADRALLGEAERIELGGADLRRDPVRLADEARSVSLFGDRRQIHVRTAGDEVFDAMETLLASPVDGWPVLIVATSATDKSRVAKLLGDRGDALVGMFHPPDLRAVVDAVRDMAGAAGLRITGDLAERIARATALDTRMARSEVEKLALYLDASPQSPRTADAAALDAIGAATEDDGMMPVVNAVLSGDARRVGGELARAREMGINPVGLLLAFERRGAQLAQLAGRLGNRSDINASWSRKWPPGVSFSGQARSGKSAQALARAATRTPAGAPDFLASQSLGRQPQCRSGAVACAGRNCAPPPADFRAIGVRGYLSVSVLRIDTCHYGPSM